MNIKQLFISLLAIMVLSFTAPKTSTKDMLTRKWKIKDMNSGMSNAEMKAAVLAKNNMIEFMKDGKYVAWSKGQEDDNGTYTLSKNSKTLTTIPATG